MRWLVLLVFLGCYSPTYRPCEVTCASGVCPSGLSCIDGICRAPGMTQSCDVVPADAAPDASTDIPIEELRTAQLTAICGFWLRCGAAEALQACIDGYSGVFFPGGFTYTKQIAAVAAGKVIYHPDNARECFDAIEQLSCTRDIGLFGGAPSIACNQIFSGTVGASGVCGIAEECNSQECMITSCPNQCCTGTCVGDRVPGERAVGDSCTFRDRCTGGYCEGMVCIAHKIQGSACTSPIQCGQGLTCKALTIEMTCEPLANETEPCNQTGECRQVSNVCRSGTCIAGGLTGFDCPAGNECQFQYTCDGGKCALPPSIGEPCPAGKFCRTGWCDPNGGGNGLPVCMALVVDGGVCDPTRNGQECESGFCDASAHCAQRPACP